MKRPNQYGPSARAKGLRDRKRRWLYCPSCGEAHYIRGDECVPEGCVKPCCSRCGLRGKLVVLVGGTHVPPAVRALGNPRDE